MTNRDAPPWRAALRAVLYPILFEKEPVDGIDRVIVQVVDRRALGLTREEYRDAIRTALASEEDLSQLLPDAPADGRTRGFLRLLLARLG